MRSPFLSLAVAVLALAAGCLADPFCQPLSPGPKSATADAKAIQKQIVAEILRRGGTVRYDMGDPDKPLLLLADLHSMRDVGKMLDSLGPLTKLRELNLYDTGFNDADMQRLRGLAELHTLNLSATNVTDAGLVVLQELPKLRVLDLNQTRVTDAGMQQLRRLSSLRELSICGAPVTDDGLAEVGRIYNLEKLVLGDAAITDRGLAYLKDLRHLRKLAIHGGRVSSTAIEELRAALPRTTILH